MLKLQTLTISLVFILITSLNTPAQANSPNHAWVENFSGYAINDSVALLSWDTIEEWNNYGFEIWRLISGQGLYSLIGFVPGAGHSNSTLHYEYIDTVHFPINAYNYTVQYILKIIDTSGGYEYTDDIIIYFPNPTSISEDIIKIETGSDFKFDVYPNPFNSETRITFNLASEQYISVQVYNVLGKWLLSITSKHYLPGVHQLDLNASRLPSGTYFIVLKASDLILSKKIILLK